MFDFSQDSYPNHMSYSEFGIHLFYLISVEMLTPGVGMTVHTVS